MEYLFVFDEKSKGWWLKIDTIEQLADYHEQTNGNRYEKAMELYLHGGHPYDILEKLNAKERFELMQKKEFKQLQMAIMMAEKNNVTILDGFRQMNIEIGFSQINSLEEYGTIFINRAGGTTFGIDYSQFCRRKKLIYPDFKKADIRIKKYGDGGNHYYAFIDDMQVRDGDILKRNTREDAYNMALKVLG